MKTIGWVALGWMMAVASACGGKVVADGNPGGGGNTGAGGEGGAGGGAGSGQFCGGVSNPPALSFCGGSATTGAGMASCISDLCDLSNNKFESNCTSTTCTCSLNGAVKCTCALQGAGDFCSGTQPCCPWAAAKGL
jgi:hypothetical protein